VEHAPAGGSGAYHDEGKDEAERRRLVGLCARLTGDLDAAEDLAQEALLVAHRHGGRVYAPEARWSWLASVARNVCLHWRRGRQRERLHLGRVVPERPRARPTRAPGADSESPADALDRLPSNVDLQVELERSELATLLDRAMALLPPDSRRVLVECYLEEQPVARTALRLGLSEGAVAMRLHRGRLALRRILATDLREEAATYGIVDPEREDWQATRIWCPDCGERTLVPRRRYGSSGMSTWSDGARARTARAAANASATARRRSWPLPGPRDGRSGARTRDCGRCRTKNWKRAGLRPW
jgi:RNA polymerase sigma-70 factor (ECF subfamily)